MSFLQLRSVYFSNSALPLVTTQVASSITSSQALGNGTVVYDHGATITTRGFCWSSSGIPTTSDNTVTTSGTTGVYSATMTGLSGNTTYYYRAYAINSFGTGYGDVWIFVTSPSVGSTVSTMYLMGMGL